MNAPATSAEPEAWTTTVAPFALLRVAALPYRTLLELAPPEASRSVDRIVVARQAMASVRDALGLALHALVPRADDRVLRAAVIELRRDIHNGRARALRDDLRQRVVAMLDGGDDRDRLAAWLAGAAGVIEETAQLERSFAAEVDRHTRARLRQLGDLPAIARPLVVSSRELYRRLVAERTRLPRGADSSKSERSLLGYVIRAAAKTSPFSTFMHVAATRLDHGPALALDGAQRTARVQPNRGLVNLLYRFGVAPSRARAGAPLALDPSLRRADDGRLELVVKEYVAVNRRPWRDDVQMRLRFHPLVADALQALPPRFVWSELAAALARAGLEPSAAESFAGRLIARGIVALEPASDAFDEDPARTLLEHAHTPGVSEAVQVAAASVDRIRTELDALDADGRLAACERLDGELAAALRAAGVVEPGFRNPVLEDGCFAEPCGALPPPIAAIARDVADSLRPLVRINGLYAVLRDQFVAQHGAGGRTTAVARFLSSAHATLLTLDPRKPPPHQARPSGVRAGLTVFCQVSRPEVTDLRTSLAPVIINRAYAGVGWLSARRALGRTPAHAALGTWIHDWLIEASGDAEPLDVVLCGECNDLQAHPRLTRRMLAWPTEPFRPGTEGALGLDQLALRHDVATDLIRFETLDGAPLAPILLGNAMALPGWGPKFALAQLAQPFELQRPSIEPPADPGVELEYRPPKVEGRIAHGRATWWMQASRMRARWFARTGARRLIDIALDCDQLGIPPRFFINAFLPPSPEARSLPEDALKPLWVDIRNPFCLDLLERITSYSTWMTIKEVFPDDHGMWAKVDGETHASELALEMMV